MRSCAVLNARRLNFDGGLDFDALRSIADVRLHDASVGDEALLAHVGDAEVVVTKELELSASVIARFPASVKLIVEAGTGYNNVDRAACALKRIELRNCPAYSTDAMATLVLTHVLNFSSSMMAQQKRLWAGDRAHFEDMDTNVGAMPHFELNGAVIGLIGGNGAIGTRVSELARAFGMRVLVSTRSGRCPPGAEVATLDDLLRRSDFVSIHCPLNQQTRGMLDASKLALLKPTAYLINTARGAIVDEAALIEALRAKTFAGAGLDVLDPEPPVADSPLWDLDNAVLTPHIGWRKLQTRQRLLDAVIANVDAYFQGVSLNVVEPPQSDDVN